jgi:hypothetical protein
MYYGFEHIWFILSLDLPSISNLGLCADDDGGTYCFAISPLLSPLVTWPSYVSRTRTHISRNDQK